MLIPGSAIDAGTALRDGDQPPHHPQHQTQGSQGQWRLAAT